MYPIACKDPRGGHNRSQINQNFFKSWSPQMAYVLGFIFADGAIEDVQKSSRTCYIAITATSKDFSILNKIKDAMNSGHKLYRKKSKPVLFPHGKTYTPDECFILRIGSKLMYNDLLKLGVTPRKSLTIIFPKILADYLSFFLRGYFDGDGCIYLKNKRFPIVVFTSGSADFLIGLSHYLNVALGIPIKVVNINNSSLNPYFQLRYNKSSSLKILEFMYKDLEKAPYLERKFAIYQSYLQNQK